MHTNTDLYELFTWQNRRNMELSECHRDILIVNGGLHTQQTQSFSPFKPNFDSKFKLYQQANHSQNDLMVLMKSYNDKLRFPKYCEVHQVPLTRLSVTLEKGK